MLCPMIPDFSPRWMLSASSLKMLTMDFSSWVPQRIVPVDSDKVKRLRFLGHVSYAQRWTTAYSRPPLFISPMDLILKEGIILFET